MAQKYIEQIQSLIRSAITSILESGDADVRYELDLRERALRVKEELISQRELILAGGDMQKRFE